MFLWILFQNPKNNSLFHKHDNTKNRFPRLCSKNGMNVGVMRIVGHYYPLSGRDSVLLRHPPLRTVHTSFPVYGSSLYKPCLTRAGSYFLFTAVHLSMTVRV